MADYHIEEAERAHRAQVYRGIVEDAAHRVVLNGTPRDEALAAAIRYHQANEDAKETSTRMEWSDDNASAYMSHRLPYNKATVTHLQRQQIYQVIQAFLYG